MDNKLKEPLTHFKKKYGFDGFMIKTLVCGARYSAVLLNNGRIGVCANLSNVMDLNKEDIKFIDISDIRHRIILNAYYNALLNDYPGDKENPDIFDQINLEKYKNRLMIGLFRPILERFKAKNIPISVFDLIKVHDDLIPVEDQLSHVSNADMIILTATSVFNFTFLDIINNTNTDCDIFLMGPSSILHEDMLLYKNIKGIFGTMFRKNDDRVLEVINNGFGTKHFIGFGNKVFYK